MDAQPLGRWIALDTVVPDPADPQALNRYSYVLGNPLKYRDPSGHTQCAALAPYGPLVFGCQVVEQVMLHGPEIVQLIQQLTISVPVLPAAADPANNPITAIQSLGG
ncbi:MAG: hypothetical protein WAZ19_02655, partial [Anaerolineae bacterium]